MASHILIAAILLLHVYFVLLETVLFKTRGRRVFGLSAEKAEIMAPAMSNQGCYNGFLVAALALGLLHPNPEVAGAFAVFGLVCIAVAGLWGALTVKKTILYIQTVPALLALGLRYVA
ncbi:putative membrane protein [Oxalobacteraceae bacterium GrIS 1.11]